jgi:hypothetical protein
MLTRTFGAAVFVCLTASASIASEAAPPVESMSCDEMRAELIVAGQKMSQQLDPEFAKEAQAMADQARGANAAGAGASAMGMTAACSIPGLGMLCMAAQQAQMASQGGQVEQNIERMQAQMERLNKAMEGLDVERLTALSQRFEEKRCETGQ